MTPAHSAHATSHKRDDVVVISLMGKVIIRALLYRVTLRYKYRVVILEAVLSKTGSMKPFSVDRRA